MGSFNLTQYIRTSSGKRFFDYEAFKADIPVVVRAMDNVVDVALYPLEAQREEAVSKRRMGLGISGTANAIESLGHPYGSEGYIAEQSRILETLRDECYRASVELAKEKGPFPLFTRQYCDGKFIATLPRDIQDAIVEHGIRNSHLTSIAPTGTISLSADNISSGLEPVFAYKQERTIINDDGLTTRTVKLKDYGLHAFGVEGKIANDVTVEEHVRVLCEAQRYIDSSISKTCNVGEAVTFEQFKDVYMQAFEGGAKGCTTFRADGKRFGILRDAVETKEEPLACYIGEDGKKTCE